MRFEMLADLVCSGEVKNPEFIDQILEGIEGILKKGVPEGEEGPKIASYSILKNRITIELVSGRYARCHDAILRINKYLSPLLGKELKIGIRTIEVKRYEIWYDLEEEPLEKITLPFVESLEIEGKKAHLVLKDIDQEALEKNYVDRLLKRLDEKVRQQHISGKAGFVNTVKKSEPRLDTYKLKDDPTNTLIKRNWVKHAGSGVWTILPAYTALWRAIEKLVFDKIAEPLGFQEILLPKIVSLDIQKRKGQLAGIPNEIWWVCPPKTRDPKEWEEFTDHVKITGGKNPSMLMKNLGDPEYSLAYAQCEPFYDLWRGRIIDREKLPLRFIDNYGPTWRYESGGLKGLERLNEFKRMELVWIASPDDAVEIRDKVRDLSLKIIDEIFDLEWRIDATTAIYLEHGGNTMEEEDRKYVRTYDLTIPLPFETASRPERELEIASFHVHEDFYAKNFSWKERKNRALWSGCTGISPTRWAYVFLLRHGFDYDSWPKEIKKYIGPSLPTLPDDLFV